MTVSRPLPTLLLAAVLALGATASLRIADNYRPSRIDAFLQIPLLSPAVARGMSFGFLSLAADSDYLDAVQVFGERRYLHARPEVKKEQSLAVYRLLDLATTLDPNFNYAYVFGANAIPVLSFDGTALNSDEAISLLRRGVSNGGHDWRIPFHLSYLLSTQRGDLANAAEMMGEAARRPGRPDFVPFLATRLAAEGGNLEFGIELAEGLAATTENKDLRAQYLERIRLLVMERDLQMLEQALDIYKAGHGTFPPNLQTLADDGLIAAVPLDPHGGAYLYDPPSGAIASAVAARLHLPKNIEDQVHRHKSPTAALQGGGSR